MSNTPTSGANAGEYIPLQGTVERTPKQTLAHGEALLDRAARLLSQDELCRHGIDDCWRCDWPQSSSKEQSNDR